jgi:amidase
MARGIEDLVTTLPVLAAPDGCDFTAMGMPPRDPAAVSLRSLRAAFYTDNGFAAAQPEVADVVRAAARWLAGETACMEEARPACLAAAYDLEMKLIGPDGGDSLRHYLAEIGSTRVHPLLTGWLEKLEPYRTDVAGLQRYWGEWDAYRAEMLAFLGRYDVILAPAYTQPALPHGASILDANFRGFSHTMAYNVTGWPAAVLRCGESAEGLPIAVQVIAGPWREDRALAVALALEHAFGGWKPPEFRPPSPAL